MAVDQKDKYREMVIRGKYQRLHAYLSSLQVQEWRTSFNEVEAVIGFELPPSARLHRPWWGNQRGGNGHSHALAWSVAGWETAEVDMDGEMLLFRRTHPKPIPRLSLDEAWPVHPTAVWPEGLSLRRGGPLRGEGLVTISKWPDATVAGTTGAHMRAVTHRGSSLPSCRTGPGPHGTWRAMPASVPQPTGAPDTACRQRRPASPRRCVGCAPYSRVRRQPHGLKDCHTLCPDTGVGVPPRWAVVVRPQWRPGSPPTAWHRARLLPQPQCSRGRPLHP